MRLSPHKHRSVAGLPTATRPDGLITADRPSTTRPQPAVTYLKDGETHDSVRASSIYLHIQLTLLSSTISPSVASVPRPPALAMALARTLQSYSLFRCVFPPSPSPQRSCRLTSFDSIAGRPRRVANAPWATHLGGGVGQADRTRSATSAALSLRSAEIELSTPDQHRTRTYRIIIQQRCHEAEVGRQGAQGGRGDSMPVHECRQSVERNKKICNPYLGTWYITSITKQGNLCRNWYVHHRLGG